MLHSTRLTILLIEDNPGDVRLVTEAMKAIENNIALHVVMDGIEAMNYLHKKGEHSAASTPDIILLDLNLPKKDGLVVLKEIKNDPHLRYIPVLVLTVSQAEDDIMGCYDLYANCYITKPFDIDGLIQLFKSIEHFWFHVVTLPPKKET